MLAAVLSGRSAAGRGLLAPVADEPRLGAPSRSAGRPWVYRRRFWCLVTGPSVARLARWIAVAELCFDPGARGMSPECALPAWGGLTVLHGRLANSGAVDRVAAGPGLGELVAALGDDLVRAGHIPDVAPGPGPGRSWPPGGRCTPGPHLPDQRPHPCNLGRWAPGAVGAGASPGRTGQHRRPPETGQPGTSAEIRHNTISDQLRQLLNR